MKHLALVFILAACLSGCATRYGEMGFTGGVDATPLGADREMVVARGNGFTDSSRVEKFVLLKASEDCLAAGYDRFFILSEKDATRHGSFTTPGYANSYSTVNGYGYGSNFSANVTTTTNFTPGQTFNYVKPGENVIVQFVHSNTPGNEQAFDAHAIAASLAPQLRGSQQTLTASDAAPSPDVKSLAQSNESGPAPAPQTPYTSYSQYQAVQNTGKVK